jgi:hypothetical protein
LGKLNWAWRTSHTCKPCTLDVHSIRLTSVPTPSTRVRAQPVKRKSGGIGMGERHAGRSCGTGLTSKRDHIGGVGRTSWCKHHRRCRGVIRPESLYPFCKLNAGFSRPCRRSIDGRGSNHAGCGHKKDVHTAVEIHYNTSRHEHTPRGGGLARVAGQSCLAGPSVLRLHPGFGHRCAWEYGREPRPESQVFLCDATHFLEHHRPRALW